jgi:hypothetical protein
MFEYKFCIFTQLCVILSIPYFDWSINIKYVVSGQNSVFKLYTS